MCLIFEWGQARVLDDIKYQHEARNYYGLNIRKQGISQGHAKQRFFGTSVITRGVYSEQRLRVERPGLFLLDGDEKLVSLRMHQFSALARPDLSFITNEKNETPSKDQYKRLCMDVPYEKILGLFWGWELTESVKRLVPGFRVKLKEKAAILIGVEEVLVGYTSLVTSDIARMDLLEFCRVSGFLDVTDVFAVGKGRSGEANRMKNDEKRFFKVDTEGQMLTFDIVLPDGTTEEY